MGLGDLVRSGLQIADQVTQDLQPEVLHEAWIGQDGYGNAAYAAAVARPAIVEQRLHQRVTSSGRLVLVQAYVAFIRPIPPNGAAGRKEPVDPRDRLTLPDGSTGPIVDQSGLVDASTTRPFYAEVWIGRDATTA